jgi:two-component system response regulator VicR
MPERILVVEDEPAIADIVAFNLRRAGYEVLLATDGEGGLRLAMQGDPDLVLLDVMLPGLDGFEICRRIREAGRPTPILMLTARGEETDKVLGLELGADDYITKPFSMKELLARVSANIRRLSFSGQAVARQGGETLGDALEFGALKIYPSRKEVHTHGKPVDVSQREYDLLHFLATHRDRVFTREELMEKVWEFEYYGDLRTVDVTVRRLREKIEDNPAEPQYVITRRGVGYLFGR